MTSVERAFPALLQDFFHRRLVAQRGASAHTIASYRDTFTLFLNLLKHVWVGVAPVRCRRSRETAWR